MKTFGFFRYFGAKKEIAKYYPYPRYKKLIEPFAGSAGYAVTHFNRDVCLYDISEYVCGVWDFLINATPKDILNLPVIGEFEHIDDLDLPQEAKWFIGFWLQIGAVRPLKVVSGWNKKNVDDKRGRLETTWDERRREIISRQVKLIKHWKIEQRSYEDIPNTEATWFVDPPYESAGKKYIGHESIDFTSLGNWCKERQGEVIVCEQYGASWLPFKPMKSSAGLTGKGTKEVVYYQ